MYSCTSLGLCEPCDLVVDVRFGFLFFYFHVSASDAVFVNQRRRRRGQKKSGEIYLALWKGHTQSMSACSLDVLYIFHFGYG